jgi:hypothetical protein
MYRVSMEFGTAFDGAASAISALTHRQIVELLERKVISPELFDEQHIVEVLDPEDTKRRYSLCRNPQTARREGITRQRLLERARAQLDKIAGSRRRPTEKRLGARVGRVLERTKMGKFITSSFSIFGQALKIRIGATHRKVELRSD